MPKPKQIDEQEEQLPETPESTVDVAHLLAEVAELKRKDEEKDKKLAMLYEVADKGRVFNYENRTTEKKPSKAKLSRYGGGFIVGWRVAKDELVKHPVTGLTVGETQEIELVIDTDEVLTKIMVNGYPAFSNARYDDRIEVEIVSKKEDYAGNFTYEVQLESGRKISLDARFLN